MRRRRRRRRLLAATVVPAALTTGLVAGGATAAPAVRDIDCRVTKCVALTFDDGPGLQTPKLLQMLSDAGVRVTFFLLGDVSNARPGYVRAIAEAGHEVGTHTWSHRQLPALSDALVRSQLTRSADKLEALTGTRPELMRPPYGDVSDRVARIMGERDWPMIMWSVDPEDWKDRNADTVYKRVIAQTAPGSIVLLHDIHPTTVAAVPRILAELTRRGYTFVTVTELYGGEPAAGREYWGREGAYVGRSTVKTAPKSAPEAASVPAVAEPAVAEPAAVEPTAAATEDTAKAVEAELAPAQPAGT